VDVIGRSPGQDRLERARCVLGVPSGLGLEDVGEGDELGVLCGGDGLLDLEAFDAIGAQVRGGVTFARTATRRLGARGFSFAGRSCGAGASAWGWTAVLVGGWSSSALLIAVLLSHICQCNPASRIRCSIARAPRHRGVSSLTVRRLNARRAAKES